MAKQRVLILDNEQIKWKIKRMAYQLWEHNSNEESVTIIGIEGSGLAVARSLASLLKKISPLKVEVIGLKMNKRKPLSKEITIETDLTGKAVILADDVANSGKTLIYALKPVLNFEVKKIMIAVLVDRKHKSYPVASDIIGHSVATTLQEHIEVETDGDKITAVYLT
jgi:pyrimidine operon attenuation protein / uracil phosphoribosyltransferase